MTEVYHTLSAAEQRSFYAAGLPARATARVVAAGRVVSGQASHHELLQPAPNSYYLAWGLHFAYGSTDPSTGDSQPFYIPTGAIAEIAAACVGTQTDIRLIDTSGAELLSLLLAGDSRSADELAEIIDARISWERDDPTR